MSRKSGRTCGRYCKLKITFILGLCFIVSPFLVFSQEGEAVILDVYAGIPIVNKGSEDGLARGNEFLLIPAEGEYPDFASAKKNSIGHGLVKRADRRVSELTVLAGPPEIEEGMQLRHIPRLGAEFTFYARYTQPVLGSVTLKTEESSDGGIASTGMTVAWVRGFYSLRPLVGIEFPLGTGNPVGLGSLPVRLYTGGELHWFLRRFRISPAGAVGATQVSSSIAQYGGMGRLGLSYLFSRNMRLFFEIGGAMWKSVRDDTDDEIGPFAGFGLIIKG